MEFLQVDPATVQEREALLQELQKTYSAVQPSSSSGVLATGKNRKRYAILCSQWIDTQAGIQRIPFAECILGILPPPCHLTAVTACSSHSVSSTGKFRPVTRQRIRELADKIKEAGGVLFNTPGIVRPAREDERLANPGKSWVIIGGNTRATVLPVL
jgi:hypothetical protein